MNHANTKRRWAATVLGAALMTVIAGCGGGGNGGSNGSGSTTRTLTTISTSGTFNPTTGKFTQTEGSFERFMGRLLPSPGPTATPEPTPTPGTGTPSAIIYSGTYKLGSGTLGVSEKGDFTFTVLPDNSADGIGVPQDFFRYQMEDPASETGTATVALQINGTTGSGTIRLSSGAQGTISITRRAESFRTNLKLRQR